MSTLLRLGWWFAIWPLLVGSGLAAQTAGPSAQTGTAIFAGGCFWCVEADFDKLPGVLSTESGYIGGKLDNPTYEQVSAGGTGHAEGVRVTYDSSTVTYEELLDYFWRHVDPTAKDRQFCDVGSQYRTGIFFHNDEQKRLAEASKARLQKAKPFKEDIVTPVQAATQFYRAEEYHQDYYKKNPVRYRFYRDGCGRDARLKALWGSAAH